MPNNGNKSKKAATDSERMKAKKKALQELEIKELPEPCQTLNDTQMLFAEMYFKTLDVKQACKVAGYSDQYGYMLKKDARVRLYLNYLRDLTDKAAVLSKGQIVEKIGQRILDNSISNKDLASLAREARYLQGYGGDVNFNTQINIQLPETYKQFFKSSNGDGGDLANSEDWNDVSANESD